MASTANWTDKPELDALLSQLLAGAKEALGAAFAGLYLHGSLAMGDFNAETSDIDFATTTMRETSSDDFKALHALHNRLALADNRFARRLEGCYVPLSRLHRFTPQNCSFPGVEVGGEFRMGEQLGTLQLYTLRECAIAVAGEDLRGAIAPISKQELREASRTTLEEWWQPQIEAPYRLECDAYQVYAVLTMCRMLYTADFGAIASKPGAARWALKSSPGIWRSLITEALHWTPEAQFRRLDETRELIRYTLRQVSAIERA